MKVLSYSVTRKLWKISVNKWEEEITKGQTIMTFKKEFITTWTVEEVKANVAALPIPRARFFENTDATSEDKTGIAIPDDITFGDLSWFLGRKTKVTIEILP